MSRWLGRLRDGMTALIVGRALAIRWPDRLTEDHR